MMRNPQTVEGRIWAKLLEKLDRIAVAFQGVQTTPEDIHALVLGAASPAVVSELVSGAAALPIGEVDGWSRRAGSGG